VYLNRVQLAAFCENLATLPAGSGTFFIDGKALQTFGTKLRSCRRARV
jgi:hypothetical protein